MPGYELEASPASPPSVVAPVARPARILRCRAARLLGTLILVVACEVHAVPPSMLEVVPAEAQAVYMIAGRPNAGQSSDVESSLSLLTFLADTAQQVGLLSQIDDSSRMWIDALTAVSTLLEQPHAFALLDMKAKARPDGGHELTELRAALIVHSHGANVNLQKRIQHLLSTYTNSSQAHLDDRLVRGSVVYTLRDNRLGGLASISFGAIGEHYVIAVGENSFDQVAATIADRSLSMASNEWFVRAFAEADGVRSAMVWYAKFDGPNRYGDSLPLEKVDGVKSAMGLRNLDRGLWTLGYNGRAVEMSSVQRRGGKDRVLPLAGKRFLSKIDGGLIPDQATHYAVIDCNPRGLLLGVSGAYLAAKSPHNQKRSRDFWRELDNKAGVSIFDDIFARLTPPLVIHNYPPHALGIPFAWTILARIDGDASILRKRVDKWMTAAGEWLATNTNVRLRKAGDGVWYIQYGLVGPALVVTDRWLVISFSPFALRQNVELMSERSAIILRNVEGASDHP